MGKTVISKQTTTIGNYKAEIRIVEEERYQYGQPTKDYYGVEAVIHNPIDEGPRTFSAYRSMRQKYIDPSLGWEIVCLIFRRNYKQSLGEFITWAIGDMVESASEHFAEAVTLSPEEKEANIALEMLEEDGDVIFS